MNNRRIDDYKCITPNPKVPARIVVNLKHEIAAELARIQDREQKMRKQKVSACRVISDLITGRVRP